MQQTETLETRASQSAVGHYADGCLERVIEFVQQRMHMPHAKEAFLMIKVDKIIGEERIIAGVEEEVDGTGQYLSRMGGY